MVTSTNARQIVESFPVEEKIIFGPDRNLGNYINSVTGRNMKLWNGACHVHEQFSVEKIVELKKEYPDALLLAHPECKNVILTLADKIGSTAALLKFATQSEARRFIVATEFCMKCRNRILIKFLFPLRLMTVLVLAMNVILCG